MHFIICCKNKEIYYKQAYVKIDGNKDPLEYYSLQRGA